MVCGWDQIWLSMVVGQNFWSRNMDAGACRLHGLAGPCSAVFPQRQGSIAKLVGLGGPPGCMCLGWAQWAATGCRAAMRWSTAPRKPSAPPTTGTVFLYNTVCPPLQRAVLCSPPAHCWFQAITHSLHPSSRSRICFRPFCPPGKTIHFPSSQLGSRFKKTKRNIPSASFACRHFSFVLPGSIHSPGVPQRLSIVVISN